MNPPPIVKPEWWLLCWYTSKIRNTLFSIPFLCILVTTLRNYQQTVGVLSFRYLQLSGKMH